MLPFNNKLLLVLFYLMTGIINLYGQTGYIYLADTSHWQATIDDTLLLSTENNIMSLPAGEHKLLIQPVNNKNWFIKAQKNEFVIQEADTFLVNPLIPKFKRNSLTGIGINPQKTIPYQRSGEFRQNKYIRPALLATAVAANWASFYIKRKADDYYDIYQESSELDRINKYYNQAADFDVYANILLGVSAAALTAYFYYLMTD